MIRFLFHFLVFSVCLLLEALLRAAGFCLPLTAFAVFYCVFAAGPLYGFIFALLSGFFLDSILAHAAPLNMLTLSAVVPGAWFLRDIIESDSVLLLIGTGALLPLIVLFPLFPVRGGWHITMELLPALFLSSIFSAVLLPGTVSLLNYFSRRLNLPEFYDYRRNRRNVHE